MQQPLLEDSANSSIKTGMNKNVDFNATDATAESVDSILSENKDQTKFGRIIELPQTKSMIVKRGKIHEIDLLQKTIAPKVAPSAEDIIAEERVNYSEEEDFTVFLQICNATISQRLLPEKRERT